MRPPRPPKTETLEAPKGVEAAICDSNAFRHLLGKHGIGKAIFEDAKRRLERAGLMMHGGTVVDATIVSAPSPTKNAQGKRDEDMHSDKKGNQ